MWLEIALTVFSMLIVMAVSLFLFTEDYSRVEYLNFEDDEYYYYVKAVPKVTVTVSDTKVKKISGQVKQEETDVTKAFDSEK